MDEKPSAAEQAFEDCCGTRPTGFAAVREWEAAKVVWVDAAKWATERTARRCVEICQEMLGDRVRLECANAIAKEFGLD